VKVMCCIQCCLVVILLEAWPCLWFKLCLTALRVISSRMYVCLSAGLSGLVSASYTEDSYGVVQSSLPGIISVLLDTLEVCHFALSQSCILYTCRGYWEPSCVCVCASICLTNLSAACSTLSTTDQFSSFQIVWCWIVLHSFFAATELLLYDAVESNVLYISQVFV